MNAAFAASNMVNQPQRPRGIADPTLGAGFFFAVFFLLPRLRRSRRGFDGRSCAYYGTLQTHGALEAGTDNKVNCFSNWLATLNTTLWQKPPWGNKKPRKRRAAGFARCWPCPPPPRHDHRRRHKSGALSPRRSRRTSLATALLPAKGWSWPRHHHHSLASSGSLGNLRA